MPEAGEQSEFRIETGIIPEGVDVEVAEKRTALIESWRSGEVGAEDTFRKLMDLYWTERPHTTEETGAYLMEMSYHFPLEARIDYDVSTAIYLDAQKRKGRPELL